jgi:HK97 family phage prohead protease
MTPQLLLKTDNSTNLQILKSDNLVIGGYASIEIVDKQNDLITLDALNEAVKKYMGQQKYRNVMSNHSNVQVGEVLKNYRDSQGKLWKTEVDDVGFFVVIKLRDDIEKAKEIQRGIRKGTLRSFSIGGQALEKRKRVNKSLGEYNEISKLELHEVTICEKGINPEAKFDILKMEKGEKEMSDRLEKALDELNSLLSDINTVSKEEEGEEMMEYMANPEEMEGDKVEMGEEEKLDEEGGSHSEMKEHAFTPGDTVEDGVPEDLIVVSGGKPKGNSMQKGFESDVSTLDLRAENIEKAYAQFKAEQMEKIALGDIQKQFTTRLNNEIAAKKDAIAKSEYDAHAEVSDLKKQFAELRSSLTEEKASILKAQEAATALPENFPTSTDDIHKMDWGELHNLISRIENGE